MKLDHLLKFYDENSKDVFTNYAIALEYVKIDKEKAIPFFENCIKIDPHYIAAYYHLAKSLIDLNQKSYAERIITNGIEVCIEINDNKTHTELKQLLDDL